MESSALSVDCASANRLAILPDLGIGPITTRVQCPPSISLLVLIVQYTDRLAIPRSTKTILTSDFRERYSDPQSDSRRTRYNKYGSENAIQHMGSAVNDIQQATDRTDLSRARWYQRKIRYPLLSVVRYCERYNQVTRETRSDSHSTSSTVFESIGVFLAVGWLLSLLAINETSEKHVALYWSPSNSIYKRFIPSPQYPPVG